MVNFKLGFATRQKYHRENLHDIAAFYNGFPVYYNFFFCFHSFRDFQFYYYITYFRLFCSFYSEDSVYFFHRRRASDNPSPTKESFLLRIIIGSRIRIEIRLPASLLKNYTNRRRIRITRRRIRDGRTSDGFYWNSIFFAKFTEKSSEEKIVEKI